MVFDNLALDDVDDAEEEKRDRYNVEEDEKKKEDEGKAAGDMNNTAVPATSLVKLRRRLDKLLTGTRDRESALRMVAILRDDLNVRTDVTFRTLLFTGIEKTVSRLSKLDDAEVSGVAIPLLKRWKEIDAETPASAKAAIMAERPYLVNTSSSLSPQEKEVDNAAKNSSSSDLESSKV